MNNVFYFQNMLYLANYVFCEFQRNFEICLSAVLISDLKFQQTRWAYTQEKEQMLKKMLKKQLW